MTKGEYLVRTEFNPSKDSRVDKLKQKAAEFIDLINQIEDGENSPNPGQIFRLKELAIICAEEAAMWAVKAATVTE